MLKDATITVKSGNSKTGPITTISRSIKTCPTTCPFLDAETGTAAGCYGAGRMWAQVNSAARDITDLPKPRDLIRDRILGDITVPEAGDNWIDWEYLDEVHRYAAHHDAQVFGYTHSDLPNFMYGQFWRYDYPRYTMNISCHTVEEVEEAIEYGWDAVISTDDVEHGQMIGDKRVVQCPATVRDDVNCDSCRLCAKTDRKAVVWFPLHGVQVGKAREAVQAVQEKTAQDVADRTVEIVVDDNYDVISDEEYEAWAKAEHDRWVHSEGTY